jgi:ribonucleoside-diphosphate reductase alpha chain
MKLQGLPQKVFLDRYSQKDKKGKPIEKTPNEMWRRVAKATAALEKTLDAKKRWEREFYEAMRDFKYVPGGRILAGAGTGYNVTFYNCFVLPSPQDSREGILDTLKQMVEIMARGGGVGINLSSLRPRGFRVEKVNGFSSGPCNWAELFSVATKDIIQQGGSRRGALMLMLWDWHPDVEEFITVKQDLARINGANLSVCVSDSFMEAVEKDGDWDLVFPDRRDPEYDEKWNGDIYAWRALGKKVVVHKTIKARAMWDLIAQAAWRSAEPGVVFMERYNKLHNNWYWNRINCVNPCVTADTLVSTTKGLRTMGELYKEGLPFQVVVNGKNYLSTHVKSSGIKNVYRLETREGYDLRLTFDHKVVTLQGAKKAGKLVRGDKILLSTGPAFGSTGTREEGLVLGWLVGDGSVKKDTATLYFYRSEKRELAPSFASMVSAMVSNEGVVSREYPVAPQYIEKEDKAIVESVRLMRIANRHGLTYGKKYLIPNSVLQGSEEIQRGFLQGLFSSDGTVLGSPAKGASVRLTSISLSLLKDTQRLLLNFGIYSKIYKNRRTESMRVLPDGKGGLKDYLCKSYHELIISKSSLIKFAALIGFLQEEKQNKLQSLLALYNRGPYKEDFLATFESLVRENREEVFDITVSDIHKFSANGLLVLNCGEEGLPPWGVCNLGSINLSALVKGNNIDKKGTFDFRELRRVTRAAVRFQDNIIEMDPYVFEEIKKVQYEGERRIGLGTMGLGDALIKLHMRYGSEEALVFIDKVYKIIRDEAYRASVEISGEKGSFGKFDKKLYPQGKFILALPDDIQEGIKKKGIRNSILLMQAPTGSTSLMANTTSGIEPVFEYEFVRRDRIGEHIVRHHLYEQWYKKHGADLEAGKIKKPEWFVSANDLTPKDHVLVQGTIQKYVDASISKTVNAPKTHTVEDVKRLYALAYKVGCKGIAYMREGSRAGVLERVDDKKTVPSGNQEEEKPAVRAPAITKRPPVMHGLTYKTQTPLGDAFITINKDSEGNPFEAFITIGKSGSDVAAMTDALGRIISLALRLQSPVPARERVRQIVAQLSGIGGMRTIGFGENRVRSVPDAVAKVLAEEFGFSVNGVVRDLQKAPAPNGKAVANGNGPVKSNVTTPFSIKTSDQVQVLEQLSISAEPLTHTAFDFCPSCGAATLAHEEGCKKCYSCGYSEC